MHWARFEIQRSIKFWNRKVYRCNTFGALLNSPVILQSENKQTCSPLKSPMMHCSKWQLFSELKRGRQSYGHSSTSSSLMKETQKKTSFLIIRIHISFLII